MQRNEKTMVDRLAGEIIAVAIEDGAVFEELAQMYSVDKKTAADGGDLGYFARDRYPELFDAADGLKDGELGKPVKMFGSWWVFRLIDRRRPELRSLDRVRSGIVSDIRKQKQQAVIDSVVDVQKTKTDYSIDLNPIREELGLPREKDSGQVSEPEGSL